MSRISASGVITYSAKKGVIRKMLLPMRQLNQELRQLPWQIIKLCRNVCMLLNMPCINKKLTADFKWSFSDFKQCQIPLSVFFFYIEIKFV